MASSVVWRATRGQQESARCRMTRPQRGGRVDYRRCPIGWSTSIGIAAGGAPEKGRMCGMCGICGARVPLARIPRPGRGADSRPDRLRPLHGPEPVGCLSPRTVDVDPHVPLATPVAGYPPPPGAPCDPAAGHPYIAAALPAPVAVGPYIAVRPRRRRTAIVPGRRRSEARAVGIRRPAGHAIRAGRPIDGRCGLSRGGAQPAGAGKGGGQSDGAQQRASIHGVSCSVFEAALH